MADELTRAGVVEDDGVRVRRALDVAVVGEAGRRGGAEGQLEPELVPATRARALRDGRSLRSSASRTSSRSNRARRPRWPIAWRSSGEPSVEVGRVGSVGQRKRLVLGKEALGRERASAAPHSVCCQIRTCRRHDPLTRRPLDRDGFHRTLHFIIRRPRGPLLSAPCLAVRGLFMLARFRCPFMKPVLFSK